MSMNAEVLLLTQNPIERITISGKPGRQDRTHAMITLLLVSLFALAPEVGEIPSEFAVRWSRDSDGFRSESISVRPDGTVNYTSMGCFNCWSSTGSAKINDGRMKLSLMPERAGFHTEFVLVPWGDRRYLIANDEAKTFCNAVNQGRAQRTGYREFFTRRPDCNKKVDGLPSVPRTWQAFLLPTPINGEMIEISTDNRAEINLGRLNGVFEGMELFADSDEIPLEVVKVDDNKCTVVSAFKVKGVGWAKGRKITSRPTEFRYGIIRR